MQIVPRKACNIITACCVLFNISKDLREPHLDPENEQQDGENDNLEEDEIVAQINGNHARAELIHNFFG